MNTEIWLLFLPPPLFFFLPLNASRFSISFSCFHSVLWMSFGTARWDCPEVGPCFFNLNERKGFREKGTVSLSPWVPLKCCVQHFIKLVAFVALLTRHCWSVYSCWKITKCIQLEKEVLCLDASCPCSCIASFFLFFFNTVAVWRQKTWT